MRREVLLSLPVRSAEDVLSVVEQSAAIAHQLGQPPEETARMMLAALEIARRARGSSATVELVRDESGRLDVAAKAQAGAPGGAGGSPQTGSEIATPLDEGALLRKERDQARSAVRALESELEETNRGVLALYAELDDRADKLKRADELKSRFLSYASHELRTPLNGIVGLTRMLLEGKTRSDEEIRQIGYIRKAAEEMREMVNDLLDLAKVEAGKLTVTPSEFGLDFVFGALRGIFRPLIQSEDVVLFFDDTSAVPAIYSDEAKVSQILRNFLSNAIKFTEHGEVRVWAVLDGNRVRISVRDTGIGIDAKHLNHIFDEFSQIDNPLQRKVRGTGLGLPLCRRLAELLGGHVEVSSEVGTGSTFTLVLPQKYDVLTGPGEKGSARDEHRIPKVLIVDDVELDRYVLIQLLKRSGEYQITQAEDGQAGLEAALRDHPDFIFLDLNLPRIDGYGVLAGLRENSAAAKIPVAIITAQALTPEEWGRLQDRVLAVLSKEDLSNAASLDLQFGNTAHVAVRPGSTQELTK
jgi:signal transduction histidine kinase